MADLPPELRDLIASSVIASESAVTITVADPAQPRVVYVNPAFTALTGFSAEEVVGQTLFRLNGQKTDLELVERARASLTAGHSFAGETVNYRKDGSEFWLAWQISLIRDAAGNVTHWSMAQRDVTVRVRSEEAARRSSLAQTQFLSRMSHELMTPLNSMIGFPEMLLDGHFGGLNERQRQAVGNVLAASHQLRQLLQDLLDLARIEAGRLRLERTVFYLEALLADLISSVREAARRKGISLGMDLAEGLPLIDGDPARLKQAILNLLDNAIKYTPAGGTVELRAWRAPAVEGQAPSLRLAVVDSGVGIAAADHERIFLLFEQVDPSLTRGQPGTGLGLALVRRLIELHGGRAWVESAGLGSGSTFQVELPALAEPSGEGAA